MKKIIVTLISIIAFFSCSSNEVNNNAILQQELIGSWKLVGYYSDTINPETGTNYYPLESETKDIFEFKNDHSIFSHLTNNTIGTFSVSNDSIITFNYNSNSNNPNTSYSNKITLLSNEYLELSALPNTDGITATERFQKVN